MKTYGLFGISILFLGFGIFFLYVIVTSYYEEINFSKDGKMGVGTVLAKQYFRRTRTRGEIHNISYQFNLQNISTQSGVSAVDRSMYNGVKIGDKIEVEYLTSDPTTHRLLGTSRYYDGAPPWVIVVLGLFLTLVGLALLRPGIRQVSRQSHLSRLRNKGVAIKARVSKFVYDNTKETREKYRPCHIIYEYEGPDGETITGKSKTHARYWFLDTAEGDFIDIIADPKNPKISELRKEKR